MPDTLGFSYKKVKKESEDITKAIKEYEKHAKNRVDTGDVSAKGVAKTQVMRRSLLEKLNREFENAGRSQTDKDIWGE